MKKNTLYIMLSAALAATLTLASCSVEVEPIIAENASFTGTITQFGGNTTRTSLSYQDATTRSVIWNSGDQIIINGVKYDATPETADPATAQFSLHTGEEQEAQPVSGKYEAIYPASLYDSETGKYILPAIQSYEPGKISNSPMRAVSESSSLHFTNVCALIELTLKGTETIKKIEISNDGYALCGPFNFESTVYASTTDETDATKTVTLDCGEGVTLNNEDGVKFLISIPERTYPSLTFKVTCTDRKVYEKTTKANISVTHSTIYAFTWTPEFSDPDYFCLTANESNVKFTLSQNGSPTLNALEYRAGATGDWTDLAYGTAFPASALNNGEKVYIRAKDARTAAFNNINFIHFSSTGKFDASGNIMFLANPEGNTSDGMYNCSFMYLFFECTGLQSAADLSLPAKNLTTGCFSNMFMECTGLTDAPELPAKTLAYGCYLHMFNGCTSLTTAPVLPADTLEDLCYQSMFYGCANLNTVTCYAKDMSANSCLTNWLYGVASNGTFTKWAGVRWESGASGIPEGWTKNIYPEGAIDGAFSIGEDKKICFSKGNLIAFVERDGKPSRWRFPDNQYDYLGTDALNAKNEYGGEIDFFGFSTDKLPYGISTSSTESDYNGETFIDWGKGFDDKGTWRTLSSTELNYLLMERDEIIITNNIDARFIKVKLRINNWYVYGLLLFPDVFYWDFHIMGDYPPYINNADIPWTMVACYDKEQFAVMEAAGCVFLPTAGQRSSTTVSGCNETGNYWTSDGFNTHFTFSGSECGFPQSTESKHFGYSVRLVADFN